MGCNLVQRARAPRPMSQNSFQIIGLHFQSTTCRHFLSNFSQICSWLVLNKSPPPSPALFCRLSRTIINPTNPQTKDIQTIIIVKKYFQVCTITYEPKMLFMTKVQMDRESPEVFGAVIRRQLQLFTIQIKEFEL